MDILPAAPPGTTDQMSPIRAADPDVLDVQDRLGHSRGSVTLDIYGRVLTGRRNTSTTLLNSAMSMVSDLSFIADDGAR